MWSSERRLLLLGGLALAGCGFAPVYGPGGAARDLHGAIAVDPPRDPEGFALVRALEARLGRGDRARFRLAADVSLRQESRAITPRDVTSRYQVVGVARYSLVELASGRTVASGRVDDFASYSATGTTVATRSARENARLRLMRILADRIAAELLATAGDWSAAR